MALIYPDLNKINNLKVPPTPGERELLEYLFAHLSDDYEIYFQPFLNGDNPDLIIMRKGSGAVIIEVKDWNLQHYSINEDGQWQLKNNDALLKSPLAQVETYKQTLYDLHIENLLDQKTKESKYYSLVKTAIYFHNVTKSQLTVYLSHDKTSKYKYVQFLASDSLNTTGIESFIRDCRLDMPSKYFNDELYESFQRHFTPPKHTVTDGKEIRYTSEQAELIISAPGVRQKIKGFAGSGKTLVLAKRAVNAFIRTGGRVLILTFNLSLRNYIHDLISNVRENYEWSNFYIINYHQFFAAQANNYLLPVEDLIAAANDTTFFEPVATEITKFAAIFIDEVQDYQTEWLEIITEYFLAENGEFVVFGDEKQNIYDQPLDENKEPIIKKIPGRWNRSLNSSKRFSSDIAKLAVSFQKNFFGAKYTLDDIRIIENPEFDFETKHIEYQYLSDGFNMETICRYIKEQLIKYSIHSSDVAILSANIEDIRYLDYTIRNTMNEKTSTTFETQELYESLKTICTSCNGNNPAALDAQKLKMELEKFRRNKKFHFWMNTGTMKLSTIHSFKGWEIHTLFLLIDKSQSNPNDNFITPELVYAGMTRARVNLFVLNYGNNIYDDFFVQSLQDSLKEN